MKQVIYVDNNATTKVAPEIVTAMLPFFSEQYGNPSSMHSFGGLVATHIDLARKQIAKFLDCTPEEFIFVACGTEGDNSAIRAALEAQPEKRHIVTTKVEHPAILSLCLFLERKGYEITYLSVDAKGQLDLKELKDSLRPNTAIVSIMYANSETGVIFPIPEIAQIVKKQNILLHVDAVQAVGKIHLSMKDLPIDYLTIAGHKLHAPKGIGVLYIRKGAPFRPFLIGGHQENGRRGGTENVPYIVALGMACEMAAKHMNEENNRVKALRDKLEQSLLSTIPDSIINGDKENRLPNTCNISFKNVEGEAILLMLDVFGICASSGSACSSGSLEPSHVLRAMGVPFNFAHGSIRFSLGRFNTEQEIDIIIKELPKIITRLREISPFKN